jgi:hypothetical protein
MTFPDAQLVPYWQKLTFPQNKDVDMTFTLTDPNTGLPYDLTGMTANFWMKSGRNVPDTDPSAVKYVCDIVSPNSLGLITVHISAASVAVSGVTWYRIDLVSSSETKAVRFGPLWIFAD